MSAILRCTRTLLRLTALLLFVVALSVPAFADDGQAKKPLKDTPQRVPARATAVSVEHEGADTAGTRLTLQLKELFNTASLFNLTDADTPKINLLVSTQPEFSSRPEIGSAYAIVWVYAESKGNLQYYLGRQVGVVSDATAAEVAQQIAERTDGIAVKYGYLFGK
ncbi:hypothetical protein LN040_15165 [Desulfovibrio subterraneus]|uniref:hypothetical protein n=1 Tax=Desulfovibrio subterraneus TaxID=2718620 RepID=UPI0022B8C44A|nr:hypothetical protein [Desulfovibrio subterraneus]WBF67039.1 hypothetical protein LN040_15165 [Desulfovibrio subterraneus]